MKPEFIEILRCPATGGPLALEGAEYRDGEIETGWLVTADRQHRYPIRQFIPRFAPESNYTDNFGMQWNRFRQTQLDSHSGRPISAQRFWTSTGWKPSELKDRWVLDAGCGAGRFAEVALEAGARLVALDYSNAVDACYANLRHHPQLHAVQGDIYALPFAPGTFPLVYSLGVLQHTPDVARACAALPPMVAEGGRLCVDFYGRKFGTLLHAKYLLRPVTRRVAPQRLFRVLQAAVPVMLPISRAIEALPVLGRYLKRAIPVTYYNGEFPLTPRQRSEWALLDTFDMLAPQYDQPQSATTVRRWLDQSGLASVEVFLAGHLVGRGRKLA
jgi:SAM-dependent methyltransferase